jgi:hypothetical protein
MNDPLLKKKEDESKKKWASVEFAWDQLHNEPEGQRVFFDHIVIAGDGGLSEIGTKEELWYSSRWFSSVLLIVFVFYNIYFILEVDIGIITNSTAAGARDDDYLISKAIIDKLNIAALNNLDPKGCIASIEMCGLTCCLLIMFWDMLCGFIKKDHDKWKAISELCWIDLPFLSIFSSMKLLGFIVPQKLSYDINYALWYDTTSCGGSKGLMLLQILVSRPIFLIIGMDSFLVKYRGASQYIMTSHASFNDIMGGIIFLNQVLGVVNITFTIKSRLYRFVFGGEDGIMSQRELVRQDVWESFVAYKVFNCGLYSFPKALALMLTWCDDDFQMLALNEKAKQEHDEIHKEP